ncbi:MAG: hypothetical protein IKZ13_07655 [Akkermansia sp.]|nr:hypothetical protein [Akkermansia sp.]
MMKAESFNKISLILLLLLLIYCAVYLVYDVAACGTPAISFLVPSGAVILFGIYQVLMKMGVPRMVCFAVLAGIFAAGFFITRLVTAKEASADESKWVPITHLDFMCKDVGNGNICLCSITCKESCREVYVGIYKLPDGKVKVYFCREKPDAPAHLLTSCEQNTGRSVFRVVVRADRELASLRSVTMGDGTRNYFSEPANRQQQLTPIFVQPAISPQQALEIASRELRMSANELSAYANDSCYVVAPRLVEDALGGGETLDIDMNTGNILRRYFSE